MSFHIRHTNQIYNINIFLLEVALRFFFFLANTYQSRRKRDPEPRVDMSFEDILITSEFLCQQQNRLVYPDTGLPATCLGLGLCQSSHVDKSNRKTNSLESAFGETHFTIVGDSVSCKDVLLAHFLPEITYRPPCDGFCGSGLTLYYSVFYFFPFFSIFLS